MLFQLESLDNPNQDLAQVKGEVGCTIVNIFLEGLLAFRGPISHMKSSDKIGLVEPS